MPVANHVDLEKLSFVNSDRGMHAEANQLYASISNSNIL